MAKKRKGRPPAHLSPLAMLRPRLDALLNDTTLADQEPRALKDGLDERMRNVDAADALPILLKAYHAAAPQMQTYLNDVVPDWLAERELVDTLLQLVRDHELELEDAKQALTWLQEAGVDASLVEELASEPLFYRAYSYYDSSQGLILLFWYTDNRRRKVRGLGFLVDFNPPWEGAVKDALPFPPRSPRRAIEEFVEEYWGGGAISLEPIDAARAKLEILEALEANYAEEIRLPRDLVGYREQFVQHVLSLPDTPETPAFTVEDFDELSEAGQSAEEIRRYEQSVGRRVRLESGEEVVVIGDPFEDEDW